MNRSLAEKLENAYAQIDNSFEHIEAISKKLNNSPIEEIIAIKMLELFLLSVIFESLPEYKKDATLSARRYSEIINFMNANICENILLEDISKGTHISSSYIKKLFKNYAGCGVMHYFTRLKIIHSLNFIKQGMPINEISEKLSFSSPNYFSSVFKREMGILPSHYIQRN